MSRFDRKALHVQQFTLSPTIRAMVTIKRYKPKSQLFWETNVNGRSCFFSPVAHSILAATMAELEAGRELHTSTLANMTGASQGYVTKVLKLLHILHFIVVTEVRRGRFGGILARFATAVRQSFLPSRRGSIYGRNDYRGLSNYTIGKLVRQQFDDYVATLKDGDLYVPLSRRT